METNQSNIMYNLVHRIMCNSDIATLRIILHHLNIPNISLCCVTAQSVTAQSVTAQSVTLQSELEM